MKKTDPIASGHGRAENGRKMGGGGCCCPARGWSRAQGAPPLPGGVPVAASHVLLSLLYIKVALALALLPSSCASSPPYTGLAKLTLSSASPPGGGGGCYP